MKKRKLKNRLKKAKRAVRAIGWRLRVCERARKKERGQRLRAQIPYEPSQKVDEGALVLAAAFNGDPTQPWTVGRYCEEVFGHHFVEGEFFSTNSAPKPQIPRIWHDWREFQRVRLIEKDTAAWLIDNATALSEAPPGTINLWKALCH